MASASAWALTLPVSAIESFEYWAYAVIGAFCDKSSSSTGKSGLGVGARLLSTTFEELRRVNSDPSVSPHTTRPKNDASTPNKKVPIYLMLVFIFLRLFS